MKRKVLIVNPNPPPGFRKLRLFRFVPYSLPLLASMLQEVGWQARILDMGFEPLVLGDEPVIFITGQTAQAKSMREVARQAQRAGKIVVCGGIHASMCPEEVSRWSDIVFRGEAEGRLSKVMKGIESGKYREIYDFLGKPPDLSKTPIPAHDQIPAYYKLRIRTIQTTRGCPYNCDICSVTVFNGHRLRHRPLSDIERELKFLEKLGTRFLFLADDDAFEDPQYSGELIKLLGRFQFFIGAQTRATLATRKTDLLEKAAKAGLSLAFVGLERMSNEDLKQMGKGTSVSENQEAIRIFHQLGVAVMGAMIFGYPQDTIQTAKAMGDLFIRERIEVFQVSMLTPFPKTGLREKMQRRGSIIPSGWEKYDCLTPLVRSKRLNAAQQAKSFWQIYKRGYSSFSILKRLLPSLLRLGFFKWLAAFMLNLELKAASHAEAKTNGYN